MSNPIYGIGQLKTHIIYSTVTTFSWVALSHILSMLCVLELLIARNNDPLSQRESQTPGRSGGRGLREDRHQTASSSGGGLEPWGQRTAGVKRSGYWNRVRSTYQNAAANVPCVACDMVRRHSLFTPFLKSPSRFLQVHRNNHLFLSVQIFQILSSNICYFSPQILHAFIQCSYVIDKNRNKRTMLSKVHN